MQTWIKEKYSAPKVAGRFKSSHNDSHKKIKKIGGRGTPSEPPGERCLLIEAGTGKRRWIWRERG